ncbi:MAG: leucine-rich repeat domain-containing protein [Bacteroidales bacterium]|nr:leucine-rich repeat domain-containing protein [Bacteroidales bacterium]
MGGVNDCKSIVYKTSNSLKTKTKRPKTLLLLLLLMGLTATPKAFAQTQVGTVTVDDVKYKLWSDYTASIGGPQTVSGTLTLHETVAYQGTTYTLTRIEDDAFAYYQRHFTGSLIIPATVTSIGYYAFRFATFTGELHLPESLISIGIDAFNGCGFTGTLTLPAQLTEIPDRAFYEGGQRGFKRTPAGRIHL